MSNKFWFYIVGRDHPGGPRSRWEDNIKMDLQDVGCGVTWS